MNLPQILEKIKQAQNIPSFAYDRVSTSAQAEEGISLVYQETQAEQYAERAGLEIVHFFTVAESARSAEQRKTFRQMIETARQFNVKNLIFKNVDRMSRNYSDLVLIEQLIDKEGFNIHFYQNNKCLNSESNHNDRFVLGVEIAVAKQLSDKLSHDMREVHRHKVKQGIMPGRALGYIYDKDLKRHRINPDTEPMLRYLFDTFDNEKISIRELVDRMNERGYKTSTDRKWHPSIAHRLLSSPVYCGLFEYQGEIWEGKHESFFSRDRYEKRKERLGIKYMGKRRRDFDFLLAGILRHQGKVLTGEMKKDRYIYYTNRFTGGSFREEDILIWIDADVAAIQFSEGFGEYMKELFRESVSVKEENQLPSRSLISRRISDCELKLSKLYDLFFEDGIDIDSLKAKQQELRVEISRLENERKLLDLDKDKFILTACEIVDTVRKFPHIYANRTPGEKVELLKEMALAVVVKEGEAEIQWKKPFSSILNGDVLQYADTPAKVRKYPTKLHERDNFRTLIFEQVVPELKIVIAA